MKHILLTLGIAGISIFASAQTVTIPVVFHVLYGTTPQNLHDTILQDQLDVMNEDLTATNADIWKVPAVWQPLIGSMQINLVLASVDPQGNPTTGIERRQHTGTWASNDMMKSYALGGLDAWPDTSYLNIWVCNLANGLMGYTQFPGGPSGTDGIVLHYIAVGRNAPAQQAPFNAGRVGTHEFGHWLGLRHMGPDVLCADIDSCADTPTFSANVYGTYPVGTILTDACQPTAPGIMWMNFMSYVDDTAMVFFTQDQANKMTWYLNNMRQGFFTPNGIRDEEINSHYSVYPSPSVNGIFTLTRSDATSESSVEVYDSQGRIVEEAQSFPAGTITLRLDLSALADGIYNITFRTGEVAETRRVVIAR